MILGITTRLSEHFLDWHDYERNWWGHWGYYL